MITGKPTNFKLGIEMEYFEPYHRPARWLPVWKLSGWLFKSPLAYWHCGGPATGRTACSVERLFSAFYACRANESLAYCEYSAVRISSEVAVASVLGLNKHILCIRVWRCSSQTVCWISELTDVRGCASFCCGSFSQSDDVYSEMSELCTLWCPETI